MSAQINRRRFCASASCVAGLGLIGTSSTGAAAKDPQAPSSLHALAKAKGLQFGSAIQPAIFESAPYREIIKRDCGIVVAENHFKWLFLRPSPEAFDFGVADRLLAFAEANKLRMRGHTLFFNQAMSPWVKERVTRFNAEGVLAQHINGVLQHFGKRVYSWDVVNEVILPTDGMPEGLQNNLFLEALGPDYIDTCFRLARAAAPTVELVLNEWVGPYAPQYFKDRETAILKLLEKLLGRNVPINAFGLQSHLIAARKDFYGKALRSFLANISAMGLKIHLTELDVADAGLDGNTELRDRAVADATRQYLDVALANTAVRDVLTWSLSDRYSAVPIYYPRPDGLPSRPLPYDGDLKPKPMYDALARAFAGAPRRGG
jgi:endo-1,4-beta-xylanase